MAGCRDRLDFFDSGGIGLGARCRVRSLEAPAAVDGEELRRLEHVLPVEAWGGCAFKWSDLDPNGTASSVWSPFPEATTYFEPSPKPFMINFRVEDLDAMLAQLRENGCDVAEKVEEMEFGRFGWVMDPEGNRVELWQPAGGC